ncbi:probable polygalacturonase At3g15720 [Solanum stenotomum]|uniref:probable polygalacturonase At3g15720 n=1 Tax=Solanum stenotomum TaxID=172797 RepID=UPI0020CFFA84|nr:probable polygalacturonase At3g15720 [Solanum stenotomum]
MTKNLHFLISIFQSNHLFHSQIMFQLQLLLSILTLSFAAQSYSSTSQFSILQSNHHPKSNLLSISVTEFGAVGDGVKYDTIPIQKAIDACSTIVSKHRCPCHVIFPPGKYLTATVFVKSGVVLDIHQKATILGGSKLEDYPKEQSRWYVVLAEDAVDVGIIGGGEINGQGLKFVERFDDKKNVMVSWNHTGACLGDECRPRLVGFISCRNIKVSDVRLIEPAYWCLHVVRSDKTSICDVTIYGNFNSPNNDGIDIEDSNNTVITRCNINTGDDAICPKSSNGPVYNLTATDCWIRTKSSAIKLGSASFYTFKNFLFDNITIVESHRGLALQIRDGGNVSDMIFSNINISTRYYHPSWWGRAEPIYVTTCPRDASSKAGSISNLLFVNITATSENGIFLSGSGGGVLSNLKFLNMNLTYKRWTQFPDGLVDYRPGCQELVKHQLAGFMMEHIDGLVVEDVVMKWSSDESMRWNNPLDFRPSTVNSISLLNFYSRSYQEQ